MQMLSARGRLDHPHIISAMDRLERDHEDYTMPERGGWRWGFVTPYGTLAASMDGVSLDAEVEAPDETSLCYMKMMLTDHLAEYLGEMPACTWAGDGTGHVVPPFFREITVVSSERVAPRLQRVTFAGRNLGRFAEKGIHVRLLLPPVGRRPIWPLLGSHGSLVWPVGEDQLIARVYTIRAIDPRLGRLSIDFVLHDDEGSPASSWAVRCVPGDIVGLLGPGGGELPEAGHVVFLGDETALPAIARMLEELPAGRRADVFIEVDGPADEISLASRGDLRLRWLYRRGRSPGTTGLLTAALKNLHRDELNEDLFVWAGCEFDDFREIRRILRKEWRLPRDRHLVVSYWRRGHAGESGEDHEHSTAA
jgi:NADPH-dependent ferric siderophore reductase